MPPVHLHHVDALSLLEDRVAVEDGTVSLILTDPPYLISRATGFANTRDPRFAVSMDFGAWDHDGGFSLAELDRIVASFWRALRPGGAIVVFFDCWKLGALHGILERHGYRAIALVDWVKRNPVPINARRALLSNGREYALAALKPWGVGDRGPVFHGDTFTGSFHHAIAPAKGRIHETQKPLGLFEELITLHSDPGDLVLDCFAGSATTAVAAIRTGRRFVGCEREARYVERATARIAAEVAARRLGQGHG